MKSQPINAIDDTLLAVAERQPQCWRVLLVRRGERPSVLQAREFARSDDDRTSADIAAWLTAERCGDLRIVLPAAATIVRSMPIPAASPAQMLAALRLHAEGMFLDSVPMARIGLGTIDGATDAERQGVIVAWPSSQAGVTLGPKLERITRYVPEPAAMLALASAEYPAIAADRAEGSIAIAMRGPSGMVLRATRETSASAIEGDSAWNDGLRSALVETALNAGIEPARIKAFLAATEATASRNGDRVLMLDPSIAQILGSKVTAQCSDSDSEEWWREWAVLLGATVAACSALSELTRLRRVEERNAPSRVERFIETCSQPSHALALALGAFVVVGVAPIAAAWVRSTVLDFKIPSSRSEFEPAQREIEHQIALYGELSMRTLPIAKILGDLACCTPDGVELESIELSQTQGVSIKGAAKAQGERTAAEIVNSMARLMDSSGVFEKTGWRWNMPDGRGIFKFDLDAVIARPALMPDFPEERDWAIKTLSQRKYGSGESEETDEPATGATASTQPPTPTATAAATPNGESTPPEVASGAASTDSASGSGTTGVIPSRGIGRRDPNTTPPAANSTVAGSGTTPKPADPTKPATAGSGAGAGGGPAGTAQANLAIPEPFTDAQLSAMSKEEARALLSEISKARRREELDADTRKRLTEDFQRILERLKEVK